MSLLRPPVPKAGYATPRDSLIALHRPFIALLSVPPTPTATHNKRIPNFQVSSYDIVLEVTMSLFIVLLSCFWYRLFVLELLDVHSLLQDAR
ncbi:hypothetical protein NMY22_g3944 [Coprinellus aureogranulatus]|nr:hypothetical protein NMY22_g3944 [Coprinellus aureogranulatus]